MNYMEKEPAAPLSDFIKRYWRFENNTTDAQRYTILPDGYFDLIITITGNKAASVALFGICTKQIEVIIPASTIILGITCKPVAAESFFQQSIAAVLNSYQMVSNCFWNIDKLFSSSLDNFVLHVADKFSATGKTGNRKIELFNLLYASKGSLTVEELSKKLFWNSRQINRYFKDKFGLSLKAYSNILRCKEAYKEITKGDLFPAQNFFDQSHLIKEIKKHTGTTPKELAKNKNDRFLQFSTRQRM